MRPKASFSQGLYKSCANKIGNKLSLGTVSGLCPHLAGVSTLWSGTCQSASCVHGLLLFVRVKPKEASWSISFTPYCKAWTHCCISCQILKTRSVNAQHINHTCSDAGVFRGEYLLQIVIEPSPCHKRRDSFMSFHWRMLGLHWTLPKVIKPRVVLSGSERKLCEACLGKGATSLGI